MALIVTRSPHFITAQGLSSGAVLTLDIGYYSALGTFVNLKSYNFTIDPTYGLDVSPFISDFFQNNIKVLVVKTTINGDIGGVSQSPIINEYVATDGYGYYEDGYNYDATSIIESKSFYAGSNDSIQVFSNGVARIPLFLPSNVSGDVTIDYKKNGVVLDSDSLVLGAIYEDSNTLSTGYGSILTDGLGNDISIGDYTVSGFILTETRFINVSKDVSSLDIDCIDIVSDFNSNTHTLSVEYISECKYTPYRISFINKIGVLEDLWFFKKSMESLSVDRSEFNQFTLDSYRYGVLENHSYKNFNVNGKEKLTLNTGFVPDNFRENFRQLMLSESVYVYKDSLKLPVNVSDSSIEYKTHVNDKLVNYTIEFDYAYDKINNLV